MLARGVCEVSQETFEKLNLGMFQGNSDLHNCGYLHVYVYGLVRSLHLCVCKHVAIANVTVILSVLCECKSYMQTWTTQVLSMLMTDGEMVPPYNGIHFCHMHYELERYFEPSIVILVCIILECFINYTHTFCIL